MLILLSLPRLSETAADRQQLLTQSTAVSLFLSLLRPIWARPHVVIEEWRARSSRALFVKRTLLEPTASKSEALWTKMPLQQDVPQEVVHGIGREEGSRTLVAANIRQAIPSSGSA